MTPPKTPKITFNEWWQEFERIAKEADWPIADKVNYQEYYDDDETPEDTLATEMSYGD